VLGRTKGIGGYGGKQCCRNGAVVPAPQETIWVGPNMQSAGNNGYGERAEGDRREICFWGVGGAVWNQYLVGDGKKKKAERRGWVVEQAKSGKKIKFMGMGRCFVRAQTGGCRCLCIIITFKLLGGGTGAGSSGRGRKDNKSKMEDP